MKLGAAALACLLLCGCTRLDTVTRVERGATLERFERPSVVEGGFGADVRVDWPTLKLTLIQYDVCRLEQVEAFAEEHITERTAGAAGPALSTGISLVLASAILLGVSFAVSNAPDVTLIDRAGNYGPSTQQYVRGAGLVTGAVGVPALVVGLVAKLRSGDESHTERAEQVMSQRDARCNERPATAGLTMLSERQQAQQFMVTDGALDVDASLLTVVPESMHVSGRAVELDDAARAVWAGFAACVALEQARSEAPELGGVTEEQLVLYAEALRSCRVVRGEAMQAEIRSVDAELSRRREGGAAVTWSAGAKVSSYEEALATYAPSVTLTPGSESLSVLGSPEAAQGQAVVLQGIVSRGLTQNIGIVSIGEREVFLFIPPVHAWGGEFPEGTRVEAVALISGTQTVGEKTLPLLRAVWMRSGR